MDLFSFIRAQHVLIYHLILVYHVGNRPINQQWNNKNKLSIKQRHDGIKQYNIVAMQDSQKEN